MDVKIESGWKSILKEEFDKPYFADLVNFVKSERYCTAKITYQYLSGIE
jgi:uracil-DNA glycosylase